MDILLIIHIFVVIALIFVILIQRSSNDGFTGTSGNNADAMMSAASKGDALTKLTGILATIFIVNSMVMTYLSSDKNEISALDKGVDINEIIVPIEGDVKSDIKAVIDDADTTLNTTIDEIKDNAVDKAKALDNIAVPTAD